MRSTTVVVTVVLLHCAVFLAANQASGLHCLCSDGGCSMNVCEGDVCFAQVTVDLDGNVARRWRCYDNDLYCNTSSSIHATICCEYADFCNENLYPSLPFEIDTPDGSPPTHTPPTESTTPTSQTPTAHTPTSTTPATGCVHNSTSSPHNTPESSSDTEPSTETTRILVRTSGCFKSSSSSPDIRVCSLLTTCYTIVRKRSNGTFTYKRGCSNPGRPCVPELRNRKVKICCNTSLCNGLPPQFLGEDTSSGELTVLPTIPSSTTQPERVSTSQAEPMCATEYPTSSHTSALPSPTPSTDSEQNAIIFPEATHTTISTSHFSTTTASHFLPLTLLPTVTSSNGINMKRTHTNEIDIFHILMGLVIVTFIICQILIILVCVHLCIKYRRLCKLSVSTDHASNSVRRKSASVSRTSSITLEST